MQKFPVGHCQKGVLIFPTVLRIREIFGTDPDPGIRISDPDPDPAIFVSDLQDGNLFF
jgi:hypothetical protein